MVICRLMVESYCSYGPKTTYQGSRKAVPRDEECKLIYDAVC